MLNFSSEAVEILPKNKWKEEKVALGNSSYGSCIPHFLLPYYKTISVWLFALLCGIIQRKRVFMSMPRPAVKLRAAAGADGELGPRGWG